MKYKIFVSKLYRYWQFGSFTKGEIEVAVKKIIFDTYIITNHKKTLIFKNERMSESPVFVLKSNICKESIQYWI